MPYEKTVWVPGGPPGLSATNLNKMEQGIYDAVAVAESALDLVEGCGARISQGEHDQYNLHMELYYTGHHSGPSIAGMKGMTFDGFQDLLRVDTEETTASVDGVNKLVTVTTAPIDVYPFISADSVNVSGLATEDMYNPENTVDGDLSTYAQVYDPSGTTRTATVRLDLEQSRTLQGLYVHGSSYGSGTTSQLRRVAYSANGTSWTVLDLASIPLSGWTYHSFGGAKVGRYWALEVYWYNSSTGGSSRHTRVHEILGATSNLIGYSSVILQSTAKTLEVAPEQLTLYLSTLTPTGTSVVPEISCDNGTHWEAMTLESSRTDPQFAEYTEGKYVLTPQYPDTSLIVRFTLNPSSDHASAPTIKRYGLFWS